MKHLLTELKRVPRSSWATLLALVLVVVSQPSCASVVLDDAAWEMSFYDLAYLDGWLGECEAYLCAHGGCNTAKLLWDSYEYILASGTPDAQGKGVRDMLNLLWEYPDQQAELESLVRGEMGDSWFLTWVGQAVGRFLTGGWFTIYALPIIPGDVDFCAAWCDIGARDVTAPPGCVCGGVIS